MRRSSAVDGPAAARRCRWSSFDAWKARSSSRRPGVLASTAFLITMRPWIGNPVRWYPPPLTRARLGTRYELGRGWAATAWAAAASQLAVGVRRVPPRRSRPRPADLQRSSRPGSHPVAGAPRSTVGPRHVLLVIGVPGHLGRINAVLRLEDAAGPDASCDRVGSPQFLPIRSLGSLPEATLQTTER